jgi:DNA-directed RNA polymerase specialized sigma24 family protein
MKNSDTRSDSGSDSGSDTRSDIAHPNIAIDALCTEHMQWAISFLRGIGPDAESAAGVGLLNAARSYDPARGVPFRAWATKHLRWAAQRDYAAEQRHTGEYSLLDADQPARQPTGDTRPSFVAVIQRIDRMPRPVRWIALCRFLADFSNADIGITLSRHPVSVSRLISQYAAHADPKLRHAEIDDLSTTDIAADPLFDSLDHLIDAVMLAGAQLGLLPGANATPRISIARSPAFHAILVWLVVAIERHGIRMRPVATDATIAYRSAGIPLLNHARRRWYAHGTRTMPADVRIDDVTVMFWASMAMNRIGRDAKTHVQLRCPGSETLDSLPARIADATGLPVSPDLRIPVVELRKWLEPRSPRAVWGGGMTG